MRSNQFFNDEAKSINEPPGVQGRVSQMTQHQDAALLRLLVWTCPTLGLLFGVEQTISVASYCDTKP